MSRLWPNNITSHPQQRTARTPYLSALLHCILGVEGQSGAAMGFERRSAWATHWFAFNSGDTQTHPPANTCTLQHLCKHAHTCRHEDTHTWISGLIINPSHIQVVWMWVWVIGERKGERRRIRGWREYTQPSQTLLPSLLFFLLRRVIFRFTILIMMILEGRGGGRRGWWEPHAIVRPAFPHIFLLLHIAWREGERDRERQRGGSSMTNFPFFYGSINLTGGGLWGRVEILLALWFMYVWWANHRSPPEDGRHTDDDGALRRGPLMPHRTKCNQSVGALKHAMVL